MSEAPNLILALAAGAALGTAFFGGLWWTIRRGVASARPAAWFLGSRLIRMGIVLAGFYFLARGDWRRLLAGLLGFVAARALMFRFTRGLPANRRGPIAGGGA